MTEKLYYMDSHMKKFEAQVLSCAYDGKDYKAVLDRTAFFPEGGGQYADTGYLNDVRVTDAHEREGIVYHTVKTPLEPGIKVVGKLDWEQRFERMQQHSGEHLISGLVKQRFGYDNVGFHLGQDYCTLDFNGSITKEQLRKIEKDANEGVFRNLDIQVTYPSKDELKTMEYRSKIEIEGQVRIISVPGYDVCACCAPHMGTTGEIGLIKIVSMIKYKGGVRMNMLCGFRALQDYNQKEESVKGISEALCAKETEVVEAVEHLKSEQGLLREKYSVQQFQVLSYKALEIPLDEEIVKVFDTELSGNGPRELMNLLLERGAKVCAVFAGTDDLGYRYVIGSRTEDVRELCKRLNEKFGGKGGGKPEMVQGSLTGKKEEIVRFN